MASDVREVIASIQRLQRLVWLGDQESARGLIEEGLGDLRQMPDEGLVPLFEQVLAAESRRISTWEGSSTHRLAHPEGLPLSLSYMLFPMGSADFVLRGFLDGQGNYLSDAVRMLRQTQETLNHHLTEDENFAEWVHVGNGYHGTYVLNHRDGTVYGEIHTSRFVEPKEAAHVGEEAATDLLLSLVSPPPHGAPAAR